MLFAALSMLCALLALACFVRYRVLAHRGKYTEYANGAALLSIISIGIIVVGFLISGAARASQVSDLESIPKLQKLEAIYRTRAETLTTEFAKYLADAYPEHERDIFNRISPDEVNVYFVKYPELHASETLTLLVKNIENLQSGVYRQQIDAEEARMNIRFRLRNPWLFTFMIPSE